MHLKWCELKLYDDPFTQIHQMILQSSSDKYIWELAVRAVGVESSGKKEGMIEWILRNQHRLGAESSSETEEDQWCCKILLLSETLLHNVCNGPSL